MVSNNNIQVIAVASGKGGAGKTTISANLASALTQKGRAVMLLDADLGMANVDVLMNVHSRCNLSHVLEGKCALEETIIQGPNGLMIVPAASGVQRMAQLSAQEHAGLINAFNDLPHKIDTLIIDTAAGINHSVTNFCQAANEVLIVICDEPTSITDSYGLIKVLNQDYGIHRFHMLANQVDRAQDGQQLYQRVLNATDRFLHVDIEYLGAIPRDVYLRRSNQAQRLVTLKYPNSQSARAFDRIASEIATWSAPDSLSGGIDFFTERRINQITHA